MSVLPQIQAGKIVGLITTRRTSSLPNVPSMADLGFNIDTVAWQSKARHAVNIVDTDRRGAHVVVRPLSSDEASVDAALAALQAQVQQLIAQDRLGDYLRERYPGRHQVRSDKALYDYAMAIKQQYLKNPGPLVQA